MGELVNADVDVFTPLQVVFTQDLKGVVKVVFMLYTGKEGFTPALKGEVKVGYVLNKGM